MSDTPIGSNGSGPTSNIGAKVALQLMELAESSREDRAALAGIERRLVGLAAAIMNHGIPFGPEQADGVATVVLEGAAARHASGENWFVRAGEIRAVGKGER